jgi:hypothetical protein
MSSNRARLCFLTWVEESSVTRDLDLVARLAGSSLCRGLFVSTKIAHAGVVVTAGPPTGAVTATPALPARTRAGRRPPKCARTRSCRTWPRSPSCWAGPAGKPARGNRSLA